jgi:hypothetical protein
MKMTDYGLIARRMFKQLHRRRGEPQQNPVTGEYWIQGVDRAAPHMRRAVRALIARARFAWHATWDAPGAPPLPLSDEEIGFMKLQTGLPYLVAHFAQSLQARDWVWGGDHPTFAFYARCFLGSSLAPSFITGDAQLKKLYPPPYPQNILPPGLIWPR